MEVREVPRRRVLVVDDSITTRTLEKNILENAGYQVLVAADGEEAWALVQGEPLDAVVADVAMPRTDGFVLTEKVKSHERFKGLPVVLVTALESPQDRIRGIVVLTSTKSDLERGISFKALEVGALMVVGKPHGLPGEDPKADQLITQVKAMAEAR